MSKIELMNPEKFSTPFTKTTYTICTSKEMYLEFCKKEDIHAELFPEETDACVHNFEGDGSRISILLIFDDFEDKNHYLRLLVHECVHIWQYYANVIGEYQASDEFMAYTIDEIFSNILGEYQRQKGLK